jgi:hypothetical protein
LKCERTNCRVLLSVDLNRHCVKGFLGSELRGIAGVQMVNVLFLLACTRSYRCSCLLVVVPLGVGRHYKRWHDPILSTGHHINPSICDMAYTEAYVHLGVDAYR